MPHHRGLTTPQGGPLIEILVGVSKPHADALVARRSPVPSYVQVRAQVDTGASCTVLDPDAIKSLGLTATGSTAIRIPSTGAGTHLCNQYDVSLIFPLGGASSYTIYAMPVIESHLSMQGIHALTGVTCWHDRS